MSLSRGPTQFWRRHAPSSPQAAENEAMQWDIFTSHCVPLDFPASNGARGAHLTVPSR